MRFFNFPGAGGVISFVATMIVVSMIDTAVTGAVLHWPPVILAIVVGLMAVHSLNK